VFEPHELEMMINGVPFIDVDDWEANTIYKGAYSSDHKVIGWFWKILREMSQKDLSKLLQYCTGSTRTPVEGFRYLYIVLKVGSFNKIFHIIKSVGE